MVNLVKIERIEINCDVIKAIHIAVVVRMVINYEVESVDEQIYVKRIVLDVTVSMVVENKREIDVTEQN